MAMCRRALEGREKVLVSDQPHTLFCVDGLVSILRKQRKDEEAGKLLKFDDRLS